MLVKSELDKLGISYNSIELGEVKLLKAITETQREKLMELLHESSLEILEDSTAKLIEKIINLVIEPVHYSKEIPHVNFSILLISKLKKNYHYLAEIFFKAKGITLKHFITQHKVEKIKEYIIYGELNLTQISYLLNYSSVSPLFKKVTGYTPTFFTNLPIRTKIDHLLVH